MGLTYRDAGVDIDEGDALVERIKPHARRTMRPEELPGFYADGEYDLAGFCVGVVEKSRILDGSRVRAGDVVLGLASSGLHSNGYSLARKVFGDRPSGELLDQLLEPTRIYVKDCLALRAAF